jgi:GntR family transcriptional repressor for pyruvate dehydrogenase complex
MVMPSMPITNNGDFSPVNMKRASEIVYDKIFSMISQGELNPSDKLPSERQMVELFKRSHSTIREALGMLETNGYITITPGGGAYVNEITLQPFVRPLVELLSYSKVTLRETLEFVREAEADFSRAFCKKRKSEHLLELKSVLETMKNDAEGGNLGEDLVFSFHMRLVSSLANPLSDIIWEAIQLLLVNKSRPTTWLQSLDKSYVFKIHTTMFKALSDRDSAVLQESLNDFWTMALQSRFLNSYEHKNGYIFTLDQEFDDNGMMPFTIPKISDMIFNQIKNNILDGTLRDGEKLPPERDLIKSFQCSRPSIREALRKLENNGYISIVRGSGTIINEVNSIFLERALQNVIKLKIITREHLQEVRNVCDTITVIGATANHTAQDIAAIEEILNDTLAGLDRVELPVFFSREFHARLALAAHNQFLYIISRIIWSVMFDRILTHIQSIDIEEARAIVRKNYEEHKAIFDAVKAGDSKKAKEVAISHIKFVVKQVN